MSQIQEIRAEEQIRFQPPDDVWRSYVASLAVDSQPANALNVYLVDLRENRKMRTNERTRDIDAGSGMVTEEPAPARIDCHYLISAWSPATVTPTIEPTLDEHRLLYSATSVLLRTTSLNPSEIYAASDTALQAWPEKYRNSNLPLVVAHVDGFQKLSEFWSSMGQGARWKPVVYLTVCLPVDLITSLAGPIVTTRITEFRHDDIADSSDLVVQIAGYVLDATVDPVQPVRNAWVQIETTDGRAIMHTTSNDNGEYMFDNLPPGSYQLRWRGADKPEPPPRAVEIPSATGEYDLKFE